MSRQLELIHLAGNDDKVKSLRHRAIDKLSAAHLAVGMLYRHDYDPSSGLEREESTAELMEDAVYLFRKYLRAKLKKYEQLLHQENKYKDSTIEKGNELMKATRELARERGIH